MSNGCMVTWICEDFELRLFDNFVRRGWKDYVPYEFFQNGKLIFKGDDYSPGAATSIDGMDAIMGLLAFFAVGEHDTDAEYFDNYTEVQIAWRDEFAEQLGILPYDWEKAQAEKEAPEGIESETESAVSVDFGDFGKLIYWEG